ncbi:MAG: HAD-IA family hydrolase [Armatimonadota bacterium]
MAKIKIKNRTIDIDAVIFDKDGTLIEIFPMLHAVLKERIKELLKFIPKKIIPDYKKGVGINLKTGTINPYGPLACAPRHEEIIVCAQILFRHGYPYHEARNIAKKAYDKADFGMDLKKGLKIIPGADKLLKELKKKKIKIFIVTSDSVCRTNKMLKILNLSKYIDHVVGSDSVQNCKPEPDAVNFILKKYNLKPDKVAMCGDSVIDMQMGKNAKVRYNIAVLTGTSTKKELKKYTGFVLSSVKELKLPLPIHYS